MGSYLKSLDDFLLQGKASGKKFATGTATATIGSDYLLFDTEVGGAYMFYITVTGLTFTPSIIIMSEVGTPNWRSLYATGDFMLKTYSGVDIPQMAIWHDSSTGLRPFVYKYNANLYVDNTGFRLPVRAGIGGQNYKWISIE